MKLYTKTGTDKNTTNNHSTLEAIALNAHTINRMNYIGWTGKVISELEAVLDSLIRASGSAQYLLNFSPLPYLNNQTKLKFTAINLYLHNSGNP